MSRSNLETVMGLDYWRFKNEGQFSVAFQSEFIGALIPENLIFLPKRSTCLCGLEAFCHIYSPVPGRSLPN